MFIEESTLYVVLVKQHLDAEWVDERGKAIPTPSSTLNELFEANDSIKEVTVVDGEVVSDCYGNEAQSVFFQIDCVTEADALSLQNDIEDWNEQQTEDCFCYNADELVSSMSDNTTCK